MTMAKRTVSDEQIIAALFQSGTIKAAANTCGISERSIYDRMNDGEFQALYKSAKADVIRQATVKITGQITAAIDTIAEIMADKETSPTTRLQAAQTILNNAGKFTARLQVDEDRANAQAENNLWF